jgi:hypothetical protein
MSEATVTVERYVVRKGMHLGPLRRELRIDSIIEWEPTTELLKIDGFRITRDKGIEPGEAMRQLKVLSERDPDNAPIELLELASDLHDAIPELATSTLCTLPILGCLAAAQAHLEGNRGIPPELSPVTEEQREFLEMFDDLFSKLPGIEELESRSDDDVKKINAWLKERGFDIQLPPPSDPNGFAVASILDVLLKWLHEGKKTEITGRTRDVYPGVSLKDGVTISHMAAIHPHPVVRIATKSGDTVCMSMVDSVPEGIAGLFLKVADLEKVKASSYGYKGVCFPMVDLDVRPDISWIQGCQVGGGFFVEKAMQQTKFRMNEQGARVQSAAAMTMARGMSVNTPHIIDRPFLLWIKRDGLEFPLFAALLCEDVWKKPKEL